MPSGARGLWLNVLARRLRGPEHAQRITPTPCHARAARAWFRPLTQYIFRRYSTATTAILVVDAASVSRRLGVSRKWMGNGASSHHWRDTTSASRGRPSNISSRFVENWLEATGVVLAASRTSPRPNEPSGEVYAQVVRARPPRASFAMYTTFLLAVNSAQRSIPHHQPVLRDRRAMRDALSGATAQRARARAGARRHRPQHRAPGERGSSAIC